MSDTTPRPDETPADTPAAPPPFEQPQYTQQPPPPYAQQQLPPPAHAGATPGTAVAPPNPMSPSEERTTGMAAHGVALAATVLSGGFLGFVAALVMYLVFRDRGPFVRYSTASALNVQIIVDDPKVLTKPWKSAVRSWTLTKDQVHEYYCTDNPDVAEFEKIVESEKAK